MKTKFKLLLGLIISVIMIGSQFNVFAADIPIKKIVPMSSGIMILSDNGDLYHADSLYSSTKEFVTKNVIDFYSADSQGWEYLAYTSDNRIITFRTGYDLSTSSYTYGIEEEREGNVKVPIDLEASLYIDTFNNLKLYDEIIMQNVISADRSLFLTADGNLYSYDSYGNGETKFIMSDIKEFNGGFFLKTNGDLYYRGYNDITNKVLSNVDNCSHIIECNRHYYVIDANKNLYFSDYVVWNTESITLTKVKDNIKELYYYDYDVHPVDIYGNLYWIRESNIRQEDTKGQKISNIITPWGTLFFTDNKILLKDFSPVYEIGSIKTVFSVGDNYAFININGEVWVSNRDMTTFEKTQLSEKSTILKINGKVCELENKLQLINGRTMYPFRECLNLIGANVYWDGEKQIAIGEIPGVKIEFPIGKSEYYVNGVKHEMDTSAYVDESIGRTYIPIRYAAEGLGFTVDWIPGNIENTISIHK